MQINTTATTAIVRNA